MAFRQVQFECQVDGWGTDGLDGWVLDLWLDREVVDPNLSMLQNGMWMIYSICIWVFPKIGGFPPKSSILGGFFTINHPFSGTPLFGNTHIYIYM